MGKYYNKTRAPLPATLRDGSAVSFPPRKWVTVRLDQDGSGSLRQLVSKGLLAYRATSPAPTPAAAPPKPKVAPAPAPPPRAKPVAPPPAPAPPPEPVVEESPAPAIEVTSSVEISDSSAGVDLSVEAEQPAAEELSDDPSTDLNAGKESLSEQTEINESATDVSNAEGKESVASESDSGSESTSRPKKTRRRKRRS